MELCPKSLNVLIFFHVYLTVLTFSLPTRDIYNLRYEISHNEDRVFSMSL